MASLIHFIFELIKISLLGLFYAGLTHLIYRIIILRKSDKNFSEILKERWKPRFLNWFFCSLGLFIFMFTYYGNHGLGDSSRIPIGHGQEITEIDGTVYFSGLKIDKFFLIGDFVYGLTKNPIENHYGYYFTFDLKKNKLETFEQEKEFEVFLISNNLDKGPIYKDFTYHYNKYWNGWRFWLLP